MPFFPSALITRLRGDFRQLPPDLSASLLMLTALVIFTLTGVMIRAESKPDYRDGVVHGYQVEIDHAARRWTGGLYDEQRRLWLATPAHRPETQASFKSGDWNHLRRQDHHLTIARC